MQNRIVKWELTNLFNSKSTEQIEQHLWVVFESLLARAVPQIITKTEVKI